MKKLGIALLMTLLAVSLFAAQPNLSVGGRFGMANPETAEVIVAYKISAQDSPAVSLAPLAVYAAVGGGLREDFGIATIGLKLYPYVEQYRWLYFYAGATLGWRNGTPWESNVALKWAKDELALGPEAGIGISPFDPDSGAFLDGYLLPEFQIGINSVTAKVVAGFLVGMYW